MKMSIGSEAQRAIILKYRQRLKALLAEHEVFSSSERHMIVLLRLCELAEEELQLAKNTK